MTIYSYLTMDSSSKATKSSNNKIKCKECRKKCNMMNFTCRCGHIFCVKHQLPHNHNCQYDNKKVCKAVLCKANPKVDNGKLVKI